MKNDDFQDGKMVADGRFFNTYSIFYGGDLMKNDDFQKGKMVADGRFLGGDPTKNCNFQRRKVGLLCSKIFQRFLWGRC